ncbi:hypothetical protein LINPERHAP2_LOCUS336, partial [Linum perenne]
ESLPSSLREGNTEEEHSSSLEYNGYFTSLGFMCFSAHSTLAAVCCAATMADEEHTDLKEEVPELAPFDPTKKKKKKKVVIQDIVEESVDKLTEKTESLSG